MSTKRSNTTVNKDITNDKSNKSINKDIYKEQIKKSKQKGLKQQHKNKDEQNSIIKSRGLGSTILYMNFNPFGLSMSKLQTLNLINLTMYDKYEKIDWNVMKIKRNTFENYMRKDIRKNFILNVNLHKEKKNKTVPSYSKGTLTALQIKNIKNNNISKNSNNNKEKPNVYLITNDNDDDVNDRNNGNTPPKL